jgi:hypothetical protein
MTIEEVADASCPASNLSRLNGRRSPAADMAILIAGQIRHLNRGSADKTKWDLWQASQNHFRQLRHSAAA